MFLFKKYFQNDNKMLSYGLLFFCALLPFQFALNPTSGYDLAIVRVVIPLFFIVLLFGLVSKKNNISFFSIKTTYLVFIFGLLATFSLFFSHNLFWSLRKLFFLFSIAPIYFIALSVFRIKNTQRPA